MQRRSFGYFNVDDSKNLDAFQSHTQENIKGPKKMKRLFTDDFSHFESMNSKIKNESNSNYLRPPYQNDMIKETKLKFIENTQNSIFRRQEQQDVVPKSKKPRDHQITQLQQFKQQDKNQIYKEDDVNQKVCIFLIEAFLVIFIILIVTHHFLKKYFQ